MSTLGLLEEASRAIEAGAALWGVDPDTVLRGYLVTLQSNPMSCGSIPYTLGCATLVADGCGGQISLTTGDCRTTYLIHEMGHVVAPAANDHSDPRYAEADAVGAAVCQQGAP